ncbi:hypothetical protein AAFN86_21295 [Roseomonas sp. CAU 1739]|uniref:hypothetical protein n=1 Tax=Roseomonas sp. CAU 1739 TaxID=3140364 RepID=UPI00325BD404
MPRCTSPVVRGVTVVRLPQHRVAILGYPRTGTNYLASSLGSLPGVTFHPEPFNPNRVHLASAAQDATKAARDADPLGFLDRLERDCATPILGIKLLPNHAPEVRRRIIADPGWRCIVLFRPNFLAVHSSQLTANRTGVWASAGQAPQADPPPLHFEPRRFLSARENFRQFYQEVLTGLDAAGKPFLPLSYIDLLDAVMLRNAARHAGAVGALEMSSRLVKQGRWDVVSAFDNRDLVLRTLDSIGRPNWAVEGGSGLAEALRDVAAPE